MGVGVLSQLTCVQPLYLLGDLLSEILWQPQQKQVLEEEARRFTCRMYVRICEECLHELRRRPVAQLWGVDNPVELLQHLGGVLPDELDLEGLVGVGQVVSRLQDVLELSHG